MTSNLEARKLSILNHLADLSDEAILLQIENLLKPTVDFWDELTEEQKAGVLRGLEQLDNGKKIAYEEFTAKYRP